MPALAHAASTTHYIAGTSIIEAALMTLCVIILLILFCGGRKRLGVLLLGIAFNLARYLVSFAAIKMDAIDQPSVIAATSALGVVGWLTVSAYLAVELVGRANDKS